MDKIELKDKHDEMINNIIEKETEIAEEIAITIIKCYEETEQDFDALYDDILDLIYISLKQTYKMTISQAKKIYKALQKEKIDDKKITKAEINNYTYSKDKLTLAQRVKQYIDKAKEEKINKDVLIFYETRILDNETLVLHHKLLKSKLMENGVMYGMIVAGGGCDRECCNASKEEWMPLEEIEDPPYHPNCTCEIVYDDSIDG